MVKITKSKRLFVKYLSLALLSLLSLNASAQIEDENWDTPVTPAETVEEAIEDEEPPCMTLQTLQTLMQMDFNSAFDTLFELGYTLNADRSVTEETLDYVTLKYQRFTFEGSGQRLMLMQSNEGLSNYVIYTRKKNDCPLKDELREKNYVHGDKSTVYMGSEMYKGRMDHFEADLKATNGLWMSYRNVDEMNRYVEKKTREFRNQIEDVMSEALMLAAQGKYRQAKQQVDSMLHFYPPMDDTLTHCRMAIEQQEWNHFEELMNNYIRETRYADALQICDSLLKLNSSHDATIKTKQLLTAQLGERAITYRERCPEEFSNIYNQLSTLLNADIREHPYTDRQGLTLGVKLRTNRVNESRGTIRLVHDGSNRKTRSELVTRQNKLQAMVDNIVNSSIIKPQIEENIYVITEDSLSANVVWRYTTMRINGDDPRDTSLMFRLVDSIESDYFSYQKASQTQINNDGSPLMIKAWKLPTKCVYTFGLLQKESAGNNYTDIALTSFSTTHPGSWIPSLIVPGLATCQQHARENVIGRALPFYIFGAIGVAGLVWEKKSAQAGRPRPSLNDVETAHLWEYKNAGYIAGAIGVGIAGTIYITELVQAIRNSICNTLRSRELRKDLKEGNILLQEQDVPLL